MMSYFRTVKPTLKKGEKCGWGRAKRAPSVRELGAPFGRPQPPHCTPRFALRVFILILTACTALHADEPSAVFTKYHDQTEAAITRGLKYLASQQTREGSFTGDDKYTPAISSLAVMAMLAGGNTPGGGPYGEAINRGIDSVLASQNHQGMLVGSEHGYRMMYSHLVSTLMLSEVSGMVDPRRQSELDRVHGRALRQILAAQQVTKRPGHQGGWRYWPTSNDSDLSMTGWAIMSFHSSRNGGAPVPEKAVNDAMEFVINCRHTNGGFRYQPDGDHGVGRTGVALLCLQLSGRRDDEVVRAAGDYMLNNLPDRLGQHYYFYYSVYYGTQGMFQLGGRYWEGYAPRIYDLLLAAQRSDGSWPVVGREPVGGRTYSTAMAVLALSVEHRQLPIYQR